MQMSRKITHARETESRDRFRTKIDSYYANGDALFREWSERDYGIDAIIELFDDGIPTGKIAFVQLKGTAKEITPLSDGITISCPNVSSSCLEYAKQNRIPMMLIYFSTCNNSFYYIDLQSQFFELKTRLASDQQKITVHIPAENYAKDNLDGFFSLINSYYEETSHN